MTVRRAVVGDWAAVRLLRLQALRDAPLAFASTYAREAAFGDDVWQQRLTAAPTFLAYAGRDVLVGMATGLPDTAPEEGAGVQDVSLMAMFVVPEARGRGCARRLVEAVAGHARQVGASRLTLHVVESNEATRRAYARSGFLPTGRTMPLAHHPALTELELVLDLDTPPGLSAGTPSCP